MSKNLQASVVARISHAAQELSRMIQIGRTELGLSAVLGGTGMAFTRQSLERLGWRGTLLIVSVNLALGVLLIGLKLVVAPH